MSVLVIHPRHHTYAVFKIQICVYHSALSASQGDLWTWDVFNPSITRKPLSLPCKHNRIIQESHQRPHRLMLLCCLQVASIAAGQSAAWERRSCVPVVWGTCGHLAGIASPFWCRCASKGYLQGCHRAGSHRDLQRAAPGQLLCWPQVSLHSRAFLAHVALFQSVCKRS